MGFLPEAVTTWWWTGPGGPNTICVYLWLFVAILWRCESETTLRLLLVQIFYYNFGRVTKGRRDTCFWQIASSLNMNSVLHFKVLGWIRSREIKTKHHSLPQMTKQNRKNTKTRKPFYYLLIKIQKQGNHTDYCRNHENMN